MSELTLEEMRKAVWIHHRTYKHNTGAALIPPDGWPSDEYALPLIREVAKEDYKTAVLYLFPSGRVSIDILGVGQATGATLGEAAIRCAYAQLEGMK